jgi:chromosome segregation protein
MLQDKAHAIQVETLKLAQALDRFRERQAQIDRSLAEMTFEEEGESERLFIADEAVETHREQLGRLQSVLDVANARFEQTERALRDGREQLAAIDRERREAQFAQRECRNKLDEIANAGELARKQIDRIAGELARCSENAVALQAEDLEPKLQAALAQRVANEYALAEMRNALEAATGELRRLEEQRMRVEQSLNPQRERINELKLKEQAASLNVDQLAMQLADAKADEASLIPELTGARVGTLQSAIAALQRSIDALGAVNLAALEELESARERKGYLDAQSEDLTQAMETLESAIRRIDRETRNLLQTTIALVFSMFQLNPAPFCLLDEVDAPLDDTNTERFCAMVQRMSTNTQFLFISHNKIAMEMAQQLVGVTMQESGVSRIVEVDMAEALRMREQIV